MPYTETMKVVILKYNAGNILSVQHALRRLGVEALPSDDPREIEAADKVIFPGVGEASSAMSYLKERGLDLCLKSLRQPVLGICLGLQLLCEWSEEGDTSAIGVFPQRVRRFPQQTLGDGSDQTAPRLKVPHMGWNQLEDVRGPLFEGVAAPYVYFVHSYFAEVGPDSAAVTRYIQPFSAALQSRNFYALQFHPEKSGEAGARILANFLKL